jgi:hydrogenase maturation protease
LEGEALLGRRLAALVVADMPRTLVIGYGNLDRQDDGVAHAVINALRRRLGQAILGAEETQAEELGNRTDSVFTMQLAPELLDTVVDYDRLIFVDAHVRADLPDVYWAPVRPEYASSTFTHHMTPGMLLALLQMLYHREPESYIVAVRGQAFDFGQGLSTATGTLVEPAAEQIVRLLAGPGSV